MKMVQEIETLAFVYVVFVTFLQFIYTFQTIMFHFLHKRLKIEVRWTTSLLVKPI